jgi:hypothetical protein
VADIVIIVIELIALVMSVYYLWPLYLFAIYVAGPIVAFVEYRNHLSTGAPLPSGYWGTVAFFVAAYVAPCLFLFAPRLSWSRKGRPSKPFSSSNAVANESWSGAAAEDSRDASPSDAPRNQRTPRTLAPIQPGERIHLDTGMIQRQGLLGWKDSDHRVEPESGVIQEQSLIGWSEGQVRIDPESGVVQERGMLGYKDTDRRVDQDTGVVQERGLLGWSETDERIDPETGRHQTRGYFGWKND